MRRRSFLAASGLAAGGTALGRFSLVEGAAGREGPARMLGIQVGAISFVDEGTDNLLDGLGEMAGINTLFVASFTYGRGIAGRQPRPHPLPDHGKQEYDELHGGNFATPHAHYYRKTRLLAEKAPDHPGYDVLADVIPAARRRNMKVIAWFEDVFRKDLPGLADTLVVDPHGTKGQRPCLRNPDVRHFWLGLTEDYLRSYEIDGLMWGSERQGPLNNLLGASHGRSNRDVGCFCSHCQAAARKEAIDVGRAREGYLELERWRAALKAGSRPTDGAFVTFWRILTRYPEVLSWQRLWNEALRETYRAIYALAHSLAPEKPVGWHIWHTNSFAPFYRAEQDYGELSGHSDFLKVVAYNNCGGPRMAEYVKNVNGTIFADLTPEQTLDFTYRVLRYESEKALDRVAQEGLSADYVARETRRCRAGADPRVKVWPGIDIDIPTSDGYKKTAPGDAYAAVMAAFAAGADGVILSRKYSEMKLENLRAAGRAIQELKLA